MRPDKCFAYPLNFCFKLSREVYFEAVESLDIQLSVKNEYEVQENLVLYNADFRAETLGVYLTPDGNMKDELNRLTKKASKWVNSVKTRCLESEETLHCMNFTIMKSIEYSFLATTFEEKECKCLIKPIHNIVLTRAHICRKIPLAIRYSLKEVAGLGMRNIFIK